MLANSALRQVRPRAPVGIDRPPGPGELMTRQRTHLDCLLSLALLTLTVTFAVPCRVQAGAASVGDEFIAPYVTDGTLLVCRLETAKADLKPVEELAMNALKSMGMPAQMVAQAQPEIQKGIAQARQWLDDMAKAGGSRIYVVVDVSDFNDAGPLVVVPVGPGAKVGQIASLLNTGKPDSPEEDAKAKQARQNLGQADPFGGGRQRATELGKSVVYGTPGQVDRVRKQVEAGAAQAAPAGLLEALKAAGGDDVVGRVALVPGEAARQWLENQLPALPPQVGGGETRLLSRGVTWAAAGVRQKPEMKASVTIQTKDADTAKALVEKMNKGREFVQQQMQQGAPAEVATTWGKQLSELKPQAQGERITMSLTPDLLAMPFFAARGAAVQAGPAATPAPPAANDKGGL
jgi:hypothetical protein